MTYCLFIDDERYPPKDGQRWIIARDWPQVLDVISQNGMPEHISFDHDLGDDAGHTGFDIAKWLVDLDLDGKIDWTSDLTWYVHSQNPVGKENIESYLNNYVRTSGK